MAKIGIVGGTFDPIHNGHLLIGNEVRHALALDDIWYMPNHTPPHKERGTSATVEARLEMIRLAIKDEPTFILATDELERQGPSYTYDTIVSLRQKYPEHTFYFVIGGDMVEYLPKWYHVDELVEMVQFVGVTRPGYVLKTNYPVMTVSIPEFAVSSSLIRERMHRGETIAYLVPRDVERYIREMGLYE